MSLTAVQEVYRQSTLPPDAVWGALEKGLDGLPIFTQANFMALIESAEGTPYLFGGIDPFHGGADCSGLIYWAGLQCGVVLARSTEAEWVAYPHSALSAQGRCVEFVVPADGGIPPQHVGVVLTAGTMIDDPETGQVVSVQYIPNEPGVIWPYTPTPYVLLPFVASPTPPAPTPAPTPVTTEDFNMMAPTPTGNGYWILKPDGSVWSFGDAVYYGGCNKGAPVRTGLSGPPWNLPDIQGPANGLIPAGRTAISITAYPTDTLDHEWGYWIMNDQYQVFSFGICAYHGAPSYP